MANLVRARSWGKVKPPPGAQIDRGHPLAHGLRVGFLFNDLGRPRELVKGIPSTAPNGLGGHPRGVLLTSASSQYVTIPNPGVLTDVTIVASAWWNTAAISWIVGQDASATRDFVFGMLDGSTFYMQPVVNAEAASVSFTPVLGRTYQWAGTKNSATVQLYRDGTFQASHASSGNPFSTSANELDIGRRPWDGSTNNNYLDGGVEYVYIWDRALTASDLAWLASEPYAFIQPPGPRVLYVGFNGPRGVLAGSGAISSTGRAATKVALAVSGHGDTSTTGNAYMRVGTTQPITGSGAIATAGNAALTVALRVSGHGDNATTGNAPVQLSLPFAGRGNNATTGRADLAEAVDLSGRGAIATTGRTALIEAVGLSGTGAVATTGRVPLIEAVALTGHGDTATTGNAALNASLVIRGDGENATTGTATLQLALPFTGDGDIATTGTATLVEAVDLSGRGATANTGRAPVQLSLGLAGAGTISTTGRIAALLAVSLSGSGANSTAGTATIDVLDGGGHGTPSVTSVTGGSYRTPLPRRRVFSRTIRIRVTLMCELDARPRFFTTTIPTEPQHRSHIRPRRTTTHYKAPTTRCTASGGIRRTNLYADARIETRTVQPKSWRNELLLTAAELLL